MKYTNNNLIKNLDSISRHFPFFSKIIEEVADRLLPHTKAQADCKPAGCSTADWYCTNNYCCMCVGTQCYVTYHEQHVRYWCPDGHFGECDNCITESCGYIPVDHC